MPSPETLPQGLAEIREANAQEAASRQAGKIALLEQRSSEARFITPAAAQEVSVAANVVNIPVDFSNDSGPQNIAINRG